MLPYRGSVQHPGRNDSAVADDDDCVRLQRFKLRAKLFILFDFFRLDDREAELQRRLFYRRRSQRHAAALRAVRLGHDQLNFETGGVKALQ